MSARSRGGVCGEMDLKSSLDALRKSWWLVLAAVVLSSAVGALITMTTAPKYASTVTFFVRTPADQLGGAYQGDQFAQKRVNSYAQLAESKRLADLVLAKTQTDLTSDEISSKISAKGDLNTVLLNVTVVDTSAERSLDIARAVSTEFVELVSQLETPPGATTPSVSLEVTSAASLTPSPVDPKPVFNMGLSILVGLVVGMGLALLRQALDTTVTSATQLKALTGHPVLATIPFDDTAKTSPLIVQSHARSIRAEAFRQLRTNLQFVDVDNPIKSIVITSSAPNEGKSSTAANVAVAFSEAGLKVLLIDADLRRPKIADYLGLEGAVGLTNVLAGQADVDDVLQTWGTAGLTVLPSGSLPPNPSELLGSQNMKDLMVSMKQTFELIIVDTPPLLPVTDAAVAASIADGVILVVRYGHTRKNQVTTALESLQSVGSRFHGSLMNMVPARDNDYYSYGYGPGPGSAARHSARKDDEPATGESETAVPELASHNSR